MEGAGVTLSSICACGVVAGAKEAVERALSAIAPEGDGAGEGVTRAEDELAPSLMARRSSVSGPFGKSCLKRLSNQPRKRTSYKQEKRQDERTSNGERY